MFSRRPSLQFCGALILSAFCFVSAGCATHHVASQADVSPVVRPQRETSTPTTRPDSMDASAANPADLLASQTKTYSDDMNSAIARRGATRSPDGSSPQVAPQPPLASTSAKPPLQPSLVQWGDPTPAHLSLLPDYLLRPDVNANASAAVQASPAAANPPRAMVAANPTGIISAEPQRSTAVDTSKAQLASYSSGANTASVVPDPSDTPHDNAEPLGALDAKVGKRVRDYPHDVSAQLDNQLMEFLKDEQVPDLANLSALPDEDREMLSAVMDGLTNYRNNLRADGNMLLSRKVRPLLEMSDRLRSLADLTIPTLALCEEVRGFGNYLPFDGDPPSFAAGKEHPVILYCEVQNFSAQLNKKKMWETELVEDAVLYTESGVSAWTDKTRSIVDTARGRRQDFFVVQKMVLPSSLNIGRYLLKVTIQDSQSHHVAEATQPLLIVAE